MTKKYLANPFKALYLYQDDLAISDKPKGQGFQPKAPLGREAELPQSPKETMAHPRRACPYRGCASLRPEIQEIDEYARDLEDKIEGDFNLDYITFEFAYNRLAYVRNGLLLAKLKFLKLYKNFGDGTFASFCREQLKVTRWQVNDNIKAARVCMELIYAGFETLPTNISQAVALASLVGDELVHAWRSVTESIEPDKITHKSIKSFLFPPTESDLPTTTIKVPPTLHESIHTEAAERGMSIVDLIKAMFEFFITGGTTPILQGDAGSPNLGVNSHLLQCDVDYIDYAEKERIWRQDLAGLAAESGSI